MFNFAAQNAGMPQPAGKKKTHRGRKPSSKPGADHLSKLQTAHGSGDLQSAGNHALNYANAVKKHLKAADMPVEPDVDDGMMESPPPTMAPVARPSGASVATPAPFSRAKLAGIAMSRKKPML